MTRIAFENAIRAVIQPRLPTGVLVIFADENAPRPSKTYLTIKVVEKHSVGQPHYTNTNSAGVQQLSWDEDVSVSVQSFGSNAYDILDALSADFKRESILELLQSSDIVVRSIDTVRNLTELLDSVFEQRASVDLVFGIAQSINDTVGWIESVEVEQVG